MAKKAEVKAENGEKPKVVREAKYNRIVVRWHKSIGDFDPETALASLAEVQGYIGKSATAKKSGNVTFSVDTAESAKTGRGRPKKLVSKDDEKAAIKLLKAAMNDPERAALIPALLAASAAGKDVSGELSKLIGLPS
jgi:hypothetical protein